MIRIDKYVIAAYDRGYQVGELTHSTNKETGEVTERINKPAYISSIQQCLAKIRKLMHLEAIEQYDGDLAGAINALNDADKRFERMVECVEKHGGCV